MNKYNSPQQAHFEWDTDKALRNQQKHGVSFERATEAFADDRALIAYDTVHSAYEDRFTLLGMMDNTLLVLVVFTERDAIRIISARKATRQEEQRYANQ